MVVFSGILLESVVRSSVMARQAGHYVALKNNTTVVSAYLSFAAS